MKKNYLSYLRLHITNTTIDNINTTNEITTKAIMMPILNSESSLSLSSPCIPVSGFSGSLVFSLVAGVVVIVADVFSVAVTGEVAGYVDI